MAGLYSMLGYDDAKRPFVKEDIADTDDAKAVAAAQDLVGFLLLPRSEVYQHRSYKRVGAGKYEPFHTRIFVFRHLLNPEKKWIPSKDEIEAGSKLGTG